MTRTRRAFVTLAMLLSLGVTPLAMAQQEDDPWEGFNRHIFSFNDGVDVYVLEPVAKGWNWAAPKPVQTGVSNFFENLRFPIRFVNDILQGKLIDSAQTLARFTVNTMIGGAGFLDPASEIGLKQSNEDFGQTLGVWGVPSGPYLVLPLLGASNIRDTGGLVFDSAASITPFFIDGFITLGARVIDVVNTRAQFLGAVAEAKAASLDYYVFVRNAYTQRRNALVKDEDTKDADTPNDDTLYEYIEP
ncbi:MAG TPA: VacJ family lipoprotein [Candidatus Binatia bacterium]|nr:VacJ family lipoprotein [Candidatus Binatia bacterium]